MKYPILSVLLFNIICCSPKESPVPIDRFALVTRHNVVLTRADTLGALSVGNGEFTFTVDASGLQTFSDDYANGIPPGTQSQWGWHSFPGERHSLDEVLQEFESCDGTKAPYAVQHSDGNAGAASRWLRTNPHRLQLGLTGLVLTKKDGERARLGDLKDLHQKLDLWTGEIETSYFIDGDSVNVELYGHQEDDAVSAKVTSALIDSSRLKLEFRFPYGDDCHTCAGYNWGAAGKHTTRIVSRSSNSVSLRRVLDSTVYYVDILWTGNAAFQPADKAHRFELIPSGESDSFEFTVRYAKGSTGSSIPDFLSTKNSSEVQWKNFWTSGGAIDFSDCLDPRAQELERRVVLSQYLTRIQCSGSLPPQETGLTMNSWYGKFHLEMHWWHGVHFALWGRPELLENSMPFYSRVKKKAEATAAMQGYKGARWQKMTGPYGDESPSGVGVFLIWQEPHPIYLAELLYRQHPTRETLEKYRDIVFSTADFMASFARLDAADGKYHLCHPLIPSQEIFKARETDDPTFELAYWRYGLSVAQQWRRRLDLAPDPQWQKVIDGLADLPMKDGKYLPVATVPQSYKDDQYRRDHPSVVAALGVLPSAGVDARIMSRTFEEIMKRWKWETTWGWDYPMLAMTAARLGKPEQAIDALLMDVQKNTYLVNGHNYQDKRLRLYLPGNGGLLTAVAMMAAGWDGNEKAHPGFPDDGKWNVRWEGLSPMP